MVALCPGRCVSSLDAFGQAGKQEWSQLLGRATPRTPAAVARLSDLVWSQSGGGVHRRAVRRRRGGCVGRDGGGAGSWSPCCASSRWRHLGDSGRWRPRDLRVLFAGEGSRGQVLLALEAFNKKTQKTPPSIVKLAKRRLADWRRRGAEKREAQGKRPLRR